jgi:SAM-dependent methyltransferase
MRMDRAYVAAHVEQDRAHWWFRGRRAVLLAVLRRALPAGRRRLLELGCGTGNMLESLAEFGEAVGLEPDEALVTVARAAGLDVRRGALPDARVVPAGWPDVVLLLDVLEHLDDDAAALRAAAEMLRPGGALVITVPAYDWLWSGHDVVLGHRRRYTARRLRRRVEAAGFAVDHLSYFNTLLLPAVALARAWKRLRGDRGHDLVRPPAVVNALLARVFGVEAAVVPRVPLPFGASLLLVAHR